ncbi:MAG: FAD-dependent monooxygenase [Roseiarcus sp.]
MPRALIAGAGIGGLAVALGLDSAGFDVSIFERFEALAEFGAGLQITPNATRILEGLGALDRVLEAATEPSAIMIRRGRDDRELARLDISNARERWRAPYLVIHRADLQRALADVAATRPHIELKLGHAVGGVAETPNGVAFGLKRGLISLRESGDVAIGADGLKSKVRERLGVGGPDDTEFSGRVAFRATLAASELSAVFAEPVVNLRLGPRAHLVHYPLRKGAEVNLVATIESGWRGKPGDDPWDGEADREALTRAFADWSREARDLIAKPARWRAWPLRHRPPIASYAAGRVAIAGDAAHPMVPFLAQGAGQAIEDAGSLSRHLISTRDIPAALAAYSRERAPRAGRVQRDALGQAKIYHLSGAAALARDLVMRTLGSETLLSRFDWIYAA